MPDRPCGIRGPLDVHDLEGAVKSDFQCTRSVRESADLLAATMTEITGVSAMGNPSSSYVTELGEQRSAYLKRLLESGAQVGREFRRLPFPYAASICS